MDKQQKDYIELNAFVKTYNLATTGGQAKQLIRLGKILVNGQIETRNRRKLRYGDTMQYQGKAYVVKEE